MTSVLVSWRLRSSAYAWVHKPDIPRLLVARIVEKHALSAGTSREAPVDKCARNLVATKSGYTNTVWGPRAGIIFSRFFNFHKFPTIESSKTHHFLRPTASGV